MRSAISSVLMPVSIVPVKSPFISAVKTGTPALEKDSANTFNVVVLPVPVAPAIKPWRLAILRLKNKESVSLCPIQILLL